MTSQKTLVVFAIVSVVVSLFGLFMAFSAVNTMNNWLALSPGATGNQTLGTVNITVQSNLVIVFTNDTIDWGSGYVISGTPVANLTSEGLMQGWFNATKGNVTNGFVLENTGNQNATLYLKTDKNATAFLMAPLDSTGTENFTYKYRNCVNVAGTCAGYRALTPTNVNDLTVACGGTVMAADVYRNVNSTNGGSYILGDRLCTQFGFLETADELRIDVAIALPTTAPVNPKGAIMTATAEVAP